MNKQRGFTLIEMVIVIFIMAIIAGALVANFKQGDRQRRVNLMRDTVISALRTAQNNALSGKQIPPSPTGIFVRGNTPCNSTVATSAVSYWVEFTSSLDFDVMAEDQCGAVIRVQRFNGVPQTRFLTSNPFILTTSSGSTSVANVAIRFTPPFGVMTASTDSAPLPATFNSFVTSTLTIEFQDGQRTRSIVVDGISGRID